MLDNFYLVLKHLNLKKKIKIKFKLIKHYYRLKQFKTLFLNFIKKYILNLKSIFFSKFNLYSLYNKIKVYFNNIVLYDIFYRNKISFNFIYDLFINFINLYNFYCYKNKNLYYKFSFCIIIKEKENRYTNVNYKLNNIFSLFFFNIFIYFFLVYLCIYWLNNLFNYVRFIKNIFLFNISKINKKIFFYLNYKNKRNIDNKKNIFYLKKLKLNKYYLIYNRLSIFKF